jgi:hypothetical protein
MLYIVEVGSAGDVGVVMSQMRSWLDHYRFQPENFRHGQQVSAGIQYRGFRERIRWSSVVARAAAYPHAARAYALLPAPFTRHLQSRPP